MEDDVKAVPIFAEDKASSEILGKMHKIDSKDMMILYSNYNKNKSIADIVSDEIDLFDNLFVDDTFQKIIAGINIEGDNSKINLKGDDEDEGEGLDNLGSGVPSSKDDKKMKSLLDKLKEAGIGTYILFQETYHKESYEKLHPTGPKHNYAYHTEAMDRAMEGGIDDVGLGVLFGLERYKYEFAGILMHAEHLEAVHGVGPHTISVPRIRHADDIDPSAFDNGIDDETFCKIVACIRIAVPYTGMIVSTRESKEVRERVLHLGISQISGGSKTSVGGYDKEDYTEEDSSQFDVVDNRPLDEVLNWLMEIGYLPSFCTACYREGRTGERFMEICKSKQIQNCCHPNAIITMKEYLEDYASEKTKKTGDKLLEQELSNIENDVTRRKTSEILKEIENGKRDFRF